MCTQAFLPSFTFFGSFLKHPFSVHSLLPNSSAKKVLNSSIHCVCPEQKTCKIKVFEYHIFTSWRFCVIFQTLWNIYFKARIDRDKIKEKLLDKSNHQKWHKGSRMLEGICRLHFSLVVAGRLKHVVKRIINLEKY